MKERTLEITTTDLFYGNCPPPTCMNGKYQGKEEDRRRLEEKDQGRRKEETRQNIGLKPISKF